MLRVAVADGDWELNLRDGAITGGSFRVGDRASTGSASLTLADWAVDREGRAGFGSPPESTNEAQVVAATAFITSYVRRCEDGGWVDAIWNSWRRDEAVTLDVGINDVPRSGVDAILDEGIRWAGSHHLGTPDRGTFRASARARGRLACVETSGLPTGVVIYLIIQKEDSGASDTDWEILSAISWPYAPAAAHEQDRTRQTRPTTGNNGSEAASTEALRGGVNETSASAPDIRIPPTHEGGASMRSIGLMRMPFSGTSIAFVLSLAAFAFTRFWRLEDFPIYFHGDEAFQVVAARRLIENGFRNELGVPLPFYFSNGGTWAPLVTTYLHVVTTALFGMSVTVARGTTAFAAVIGGAALAFFVRDSLRLRTWWALPLILAEIPTWFLHSRTTFETAYCASGFAVFLWCYGRYRAGEARWGAYAVLAAAFTFYTYTNGQLIIGLTGALLAAVDARHHWRMRRQLGWVLAAGLLALVPYVMYVRNAPGATTEQLWRVSSYLVQDISFGEKVRQFAVHYAAGLDPRYWFLPNPHELSRHAMLGYAYVPTWFFPFAAIGLASVLLGLRLPGYRYVFVALLATPIGASLADVGITRVLAVVVPLALLTHIGLDSALAKVGSVVHMLARRGVRIAQTVAQNQVQWGFAGGTLLWLGLALPGAVMMRDGLENGPRWFTDYGLYGQQWGAVQVFREISERAVQHPDDLFFVSSTWANGTDLYLPFFVPELQDTGRVRMGNVRDLLSVRRDLTRKMVWVMTSDEVELARSSKRFKAIDIEASLPYPNGSSGFSFARLEYVANVEEVVAAERAARVALRSGQVVVDGERLAVRHSFLDGGGLADIFDNNPRTLGRFNGGNPATLEWAFPSPRKVGTVVLAMTAGNWHVSVAALRPDGVIETVETDVDARSDPVVTLDLPEGIVGAIRVMITSRVHTDEAIIHLRDVTWQ